MHHDSLLNWGFCALGRAATGHNRQFTAMDVRTSGAQAAAQSLSGGNLQKFIVGRELALNPKVLIAAQPTWGVDVAAAAAHPAKAHRSARCWCGCADCVRGIGRVDRNL